MSRFDGRNQGEVELEDDEDHQDFISTEHVSLTEELQQKQSSAIQELGNILAEFQIGNDETESCDRSDLLSMIKHLHRTLRHSKLKPLNSDFTEDDNLSADIVDVDNITDEKLKIEVKKSMEIGAQN